MASQFVRKITDTTINEPIKATTTNGDLIITKDDKVLINLNGTLKDLTAGKDGYMPVIGGRNYVLNTGIPIVVHGKGTNKSDTTGKLVFCSPIKYWGVTGKTYTISFRWTLSTALTSSGKASIIFEQSPWQEQRFTIPANTTSGNISLTFSLIDGITTATIDIKGMNLRVNSWLVASNTLTIDKFKFEAGNVATDWSPAPEDVQSDIATANTAIKKNTDDIKTANTNIKKNTDDITQLKADIEALKPTE